MDLDDWPLIERENFLYFVTLARRCGTPEDRSVFAGQLRSALVTAFALDGRWVDRDQELESARVDEQQRRAGLLIDRAYRLADPLTDWEGFTDALWEGRQWLFLEPAAR